MRIRIGKIDHDVTQALGHTDPTSVMAVTAALLL
ncbi:hypothetical protein QFZ76_000354 [Streptomyces sp. V4I2]|nr:hypothetical protein [Streptomyces sp. V4I2]